MKKHPSAAVLAVCAVLLSAPLSAQSGDDGPVLNPDIMTYFQREMTSFMRYQSGREDNTPFYLSARVQSVSMDIERDELIASDGGGDDYYSNFNGNFLIGAQKKIGGRFYLPVYVAFAKTSLDGVPEEGALVIDGLPLFNSWVTERNESWLFGSGLFFNGETLKGGLFAGYSLRNRGFDSRGQYLHTGKTRPDSYSREENDFTHTYRIALLPLVNTSRWHYVGKVLDSVLGYVGMGDLVEIYAGEEKDNTAEAIVKALNYGLDLAFRRFEFNHVTLGLEALYRRDNYDAAAKTDTFGGVLTLKVPVGRFAFAFTPELGYKRFYSVSKYFPSRYPDTQYCDIGFSFSFGKYSLKMTYKYDGITQAGFGLLFDVNDALSVVADLRIHERKYETEKLEVTEKISVGGSGIRYRYGGVLGDD
jgi:hypothetical protein